MNSVQIRIQTQSFFKLKLLWIAVLHFRALRELRQTFRHLQKSRVEYNYVTRLTAPPLLRTRFALMQGRSHVPQTAHALTAEASRVRGQEHRQSQTGSPSVTLRALTSNHREHDPMMNVLLKLNPGDRKLLTHANLSGGEDQSLWLTSSTSFISARTLSDICCVLIRKLLSGDVTAGLSSKASL